MDLAFGDIPEGTKARMLVNSFSTYSRWEEKDLPNEEVARNVVDLTDADLDWIWSDEGTEPAPRFLSAERRAPLFKLPYNGRRMSTKTSKDASDRIGTIACIPWDGLPRRAFLMPGEGLRPRIKEGDVLVFDPSFVQLRTVKPRHVVWAAAGKRDILGVYDETREGQVLVEDLGDEEPFALGKWVIKGVCVEVIRGHDGRKPVHYRYLDGLSVEKLDEN